MNSPTELPPAIAGLFTAINAREVGALAQYFTDDVSYQLLVPHPPVVGRDAVVSALGDSIVAADRVSWEVRTWSTRGNVTFVERLDRFWYGEREAAIECTGVFELTGARIASVRDYADLDSWRRRKADALNT